MSGKRIGHRQAGSGRLPKKKQHNKNKSINKNRDNERYGREDSGNAEE